MFKTLNHITLAVKDIEKSFAFYKDIIGLKPLVKWDKGAYFLAGNIWFCLNFDKNRTPNPCYTHYAFSVTKEKFQEISKKIIDYGAIIFKENTSFGESFYFLDPDQHKLELHVGDWKTRLEHKKSNPGKWKEVEWFI